MIWNGRPAEVTALGLLLDCTYAEVADAGAHPHRFDRPFLIGQFELWEEYLLPAVAAAAAPLQARRRAASGVWHSLLSRARPEHQRWIGEHLAGRGLKLPTSPDSGPAAELDGDLKGLTVLQTELFRRLRGLGELSSWRRWELVAAGALGAGLGEETMRIASGLSGGRRQRAAGQLLRKLVDTREGWTGPAPKRITVSTAGRLLDGLDFTGARLREVSGTGPVLVRLDVRRIDPPQDTIVVVTLHGPAGLPALDIPPDGLAVTGRPELVATADDVMLSVPVAGGDWTVHAAAGSWYAD